MCDSRANNNRKCGGGSGVPEIMPSWLKCPPSIRERSYPIPDGVDIIPISQGGRNGPAKKKQSFRCGQCGVDAKPKEIIKPNAPADCPMMKARCPGLVETKTEGKGGSIIERIKNFLGIGKEEACQQLKIPDEQITHHRDVFNTPLICRKDGYFAPLLCKVECQGKPDGGCRCGEEQEEAAEELFEDEVEYEDESDEYEYYDEEEFCEEDEAVCVEYGEDSEEVVDEAPGSAGAREEKMICLCTCHTEEETGGGGSLGPEQVGEEEECVEDAEGECVVEESAECMDPECKFFLEDQDGKKRKKENFAEVGKSPEEEDKQNCIAMNNFLIRVQAPFSETTTNETCEQIIARLLNKKPAYPEPGPRPEKDKQDSGKESKEDIQFVVKQISVEEPTCECPPQPVKCKNEGVEEIKKEDSPPSVTDESKEPPPPVDGQGPDCECKCGCEQPEQEAPPPPENNNDEPPPTFGPPPPPPQNDCEVLSEEELLKKPFRDIKCGCPKPICTSDLAEFASVWTPPPPPPCPKCGIGERGGTEDCYLCHLTRRMRSGLPEICEKPTFADEPKIEKEPAGACSPEYLDDGSIKYKGGMCMSLSNSFLWHIVKRTPAGGFFDRYTGECGEDVRLQALMGKKTYSEAFSACYTRKEDGLEYSGGACLENANRFLWGLKPIDEKEEAEKANRTCRKSPPTESSAKAPANKCPAPPSQ